MKRYLAIFLCIIMVAALFAGCQNYQARRTVPNYPVNYKNNTNTNTNPNLLPNDMTGRNFMNTTPNTNTGRYPGVYGGNYGGNYGNMPGNTNLGAGQNGGVGRFGAGGVGNNVAGGGMGTGIASAEFTKSDVGYCKTTASAPIKTGAGNNYTTIATVPAGQQLKVLGNVGNWFVVQVPNTNRIGAIPKTQATPYSSQTNPAPAKVPDTGTATATADESRILQLCNAERAKVGAKPLKSNMEVTKLARLKSQDMVNKNYFDHNSPTYGSPFDMMKKYGVSYMYAGENIAMNQSADKAFQAWMNSEGHRKNILNPNFTELGVGIAPKGNGSFIYTQMFIGK